MESASNSNPCPLSSRRQPAELYAKLVIIHFVIVGVYLHLKHLRREVTDVFTTILVVLCPLAGAFMTILPVPLLIVQCVVCLGDKDLLKRSLGLLLGAMPKQENSTEKPREYTMKLFRRILVLLAVLIQCGGSIWLFSRRRVIGADALYDHHVLQLAVLGFTCSLMSIVQIIVKPTFPLSAQSTWRTDWLMFFNPKLVLHFRLRSTADHPRRFAVSRIRRYEDIKNISRFLTFCVTWIAAVSAMAIGKGCGLNVPPISPYIILIRRIFFTNYGVDYALVSRLDEHISMGIVSLFLGTYNLYYLGRAFNDNQNRIASVLKSFGMFWALKYISLPVLDVLSLPLRYTVTWWRLLSTSPILTLEPGSACPTSQYELKTYDLIAWDHITTFGNAPTACPCPKGLKDEWAGWIWNLT